MKSAINEIYYRENVNYETVETTDKYWKIFNNINKKCKEFESNLTKEQITVFRQIIDLHAELSASSEESNFKAGFKLGVQIGFEVNR